MKSIYNFITKYKKEIIVILILSIISIYYFYYIQNFISEGFIFGINWDNIIKAAEESVDCVGSFGAFDSCSAPCGGGTQSRTYTIQTNAEKLGATCPHPNGYIDTQNCNTQPCPINCAGSFGAFDTCSAPCGSGIKSRTYTIQTNAEHGGTTCPHPNGHIDTQNCNTQPCPPIDCVGSFGAFDSCSASCGGGTKSRTYTIQTNAENRGTTCPYPNGHIDTQNCNTQPCIAPAPTPAPNIICNNLNSSNCNIENTCYYINNTCNSKTNFFSLVDIQSNKIKCTITKSSEQPNLFVLECINTNFIKNILIKGLIINNSCFSNNEYLYNKQCNILLSDNILVNKEFQIKNNLITFDNISGKLSISPLLTKEQVDIIKKQNNIINIIDIYNNKIELKIDIYDETNTLTKTVRDMYFYNKNLNNISKIKQNISSIISN
jgi:hypothetical protein